LRGGGTEPYHVARRDKTEGRTFAVNDAITDARNYFTVFLQSILGQLLIEDLRALSVCFEIAVSDGGDPPWRLVVTEGRLTAVGHEGPPAACRFTLDAATLLEVAAGRIAPQEAFFDLRVQLEGDMETGLKLSTVLAPFFQRYAYLP